MTRLSCVLVHPPAPVRQLILYLHGNGGNKFECLQLLPFLPEGFALGSFDFAGCGKSEG
jgi:hypothetical protein